MVERRFLWVLLLGLVISSAGAVGSPFPADSPTAPVLKALASLEAALARGTGRTAALAGVVRHELVPLVDTEGIARRVTGPRWQALASPARGRLNFRVRSRLERLGVAALTEHADAVRRWLQGMTVLPARPTAPNRALVRLRHPRAAPDEVQLSLVRNPGGWQVANATASGFSLAGMAQAVLAPTMGGRAQ